MKLGFFERVELGYTAVGDHRLFNADCLRALKSVPESFCDSIVTDPPAGISFMGKGWDGDKGGRDQWIAWLTDVMREAYRVLKPGAHGLVWAIPRTSHWTATALENAGFEVRDVVTHLFGTGFPKSLDVSKAIDKAAGAERTEKTRQKHQGAITNDGINEGWQRPWRNDPEALERSKWDFAPATDAAKQWQGFGTALKPASEHWILVRKPLSEGTVAKNVLKHGTGALNIDGCRIGNDTISTHGSGDKLARMKTGASVGVGEYRQHVGRFPSNLVLDEEAAATLDEQSGSSTSSDRPRNNGAFKSVAKGAETARVSHGHSDAGGASRFFYVAKASKSDRGEGNTHPTVKSSTLMSYLVRLVTPPGGTVLDPFMGSGSTGAAIRSDGFKFFGIEKDPEYFRISVSRLKGN